MPLQAKQSATGNAPREEAEMPNRSETAPPRSEESGEARELERKVRDLEIATQAKDFYIERLETDRTENVEQLVGLSRYVGELETQLLQLGGAPRGDHSLPQGAEPFRNMRSDADSARDAEISKG